MKASHHLLVLLLFISFNLLAQTPADTSSLEKVKVPKKSIFEHVASKSNIPQVILTTDLKKIIKNKLTGEILDAQIEIYDGEIKESYAIELSPRGKSRRRICYMPPLKLNFKKGELKDKGIKKKYDDVKLVTYCKDRDTYESYILREYYAYKLYNILTDYSFNVQLIEITYRDSLERIQPVSRYGFIIENTDEMANRLGAKEHSNYLMSRDSLDHFQYDVMALFQYMISNTDWKIDMLHNMKMIKVKKSDIVIPVPYDFDYSGFVNTLYSVPNPDVNQTHVRERCFMGECRDANELQKVREHFLSKKEEILTCPNDIPLTKKQCKQTIKYLKSFYKVLESDKKFRKKCLKS